MNFLIILTPNIGQNIQPISDKTKIQEIVIAIGLNFELWEVSAMSKLEKN